ncbi:MAG: RNA-binding domain-containing protein [Sphaerochaeta sp.]
MKDTGQISMTYEDSLVFSNTHLLKSAVAFVNTRGGIISIGANDSNSTDGIPSSALFQILEAIEEVIIGSCDPPIIPDSKIQEVDGKNVILVHIPRGMQRPYCIKDEGLLDGVYVRVDGTTRRASHHLIQDLILQGQNRHYDQEIAIDHIISEKAVNTLCADMYTVAKDNAEGKPVKLLTKQELIDWNLLAEEDEQLIPKQGFLLLEGSSSIDTDAQIQCALFKSTSRATFLDRRDLAGPLYRQVHDAYVFVMQHIELCSHFEGVHRTERFELPDEAIRELIPEFRGFCT